MRKLLFLYLFISVTTSAQVTNNQLRSMAATEAQNQGVDPVALEQRLVARGIDVNMLTLEEATALRPIIEEEIQALKAAELPTKTQVALPKSDTVALNKRIEVADVETLDSKDAIDKTSSVFGKNIFKNGSISLFEVSKDYVPSDAYILGPGDVVTVSIFGRSQADLQFTIKPDGFIEPTNLPKVYLKGISLGKARTLVENRFKNFYQFEKGQFALTLTTARTLTIQITGAVERPGTYTLSAYNTAFNALMAAGGPSNLGTVRNIQVINGRSMKTLDVYEYLFNPKKQSDYYLQNNDILFVPYIGDVVEIEGAVKQTGIFELKDGESFASLLEYTGGYLSNALTDEIQLVRIDEQGTFVKEFKGSELKELEFKDGDRIIINQQTSDRKDYVEVKGAVNYPGIYGLRDYTTLKTLLEKVNLQEETRMDVGYLLRIAANGASSVLSFSPNQILEGRTDIMLQAEDVVQLLNARDFTDTTVVTVRGAVRDTGMYYLDSNVTVPTLINLSNGLTREARSDVGYVYRTFPDGATEVLPVKLTDEGFTFQNGDELRILKKQSILRDAKISISGEVINPIELPYDKTITLNEVIALAGGVNFAGDESEIIVYRMPFEGNTIGQVQEQHLNLKSDGNFTFQPYDAIVVRRKYGFEFQEFVTVKGEVMYPGKYAISQGETVKDLIAKAGGLTNQAFADGAEFTRSGKGALTIQLEKVLKYENSSENIPLVAGDIIEIPTKDFTVEIRIANTEVEKFGAFSEDYSGESIHVAYVKGKSAKWYVKHMAGGYGENAKKNNTVVVYANGRAKNYRPWRIVNKSPKVLPGSMIVVGEKPEKLQKQKEEIDWGAFSQNLIAQVTSLLTVITLATKL